MEGEVLEIGAIKNGLEVNANWSSSKDIWVDVVNGGVLAKYSGTNNSTTVITSSCDGETSATDIKVTKNLTTTGTRFKVLDMSIGTSVTYQLEFVDGGIVVPYVTLNVFNSNPEVAVVDSDGNVAGLTNGKTLITAIYNGKKYGHIIEVADAKAMAISAEAPTKKKRTTKK